MGVVRVTTGLIIVVPSEVWITKTRKNWMSWKMDELKDRPPTWTGWLYTYPSDLKILIRQNQHIQVGLIKVTGTPVFHVVTVTNLCSPCQFLHCVGHSRCWTQTYSDPHFFTDKLLTGVWLHDALSPPTEIHIFWLRHFLLHAELHLQLQDAAT